MAILVTGGTKGIGLEIACAFAAPGVAVFLNYHADEAAAARACRTVEALGARCHAIKGDVGTPEGAGAVIEAVRAETDRLDQLVHCAVRALVAPALALDGAEGVRVLARHDPVMALDVLDDAFAVQRAGPDLRQHVERAARDEARLEALDASILGQRVRGVPPLAREPQIADQPDAERAHRLAVGRRERAQRIRAVDGAPAHGAAVGRPVATEVAEVRRALEREAPLTGGRRGQA
jgi:hypothetical protein